MNRRIRVDDPVVADVLMQLPRAALLGHSGRSFLEHLLGTWRILADWRMPRAVCRAGFMHSAYSTSFYPHPLFGLDERATVRRMIGREAEELAFRFCTMDRRGFWDKLARRPGAATLTYPDRLRSGAPVRVPRETLSRLLVIESANIAEQSKAPDGGPMPWMSRVLRWWEFLDEQSIPLRTAARPRLSKRADELAIKVYRRALSLSAARAIPLLDRTIELNPWAGEPRILRAQCVLETKREGDAHAEAEAGADLLRRWAVPWDKRLTLEGWTALAEKIGRPALRRRSLQGGFQLACVSLTHRAPRPVIKRVKAPRTGVAAA